MIAAINPIQNHTELTSTPATILEESRRLSLRFSKSVILLAPKPAFTMRPAFSGGLSLLQKVRENQWKGCRTFVLQTYDEMADLLESDLTGNAV